MQTAQKIDDQDNQEDRSETYAGPSPIAPAPMALIATAAAKKQYQDNN
jgi:hypothetical protein